MYKQIDRKKENKATTATNCTHRNKYNINQYFNFMDKMHPKTIQRVIAAMSQDQMTQVKTLAKSTGGFFSQEESYEIFGGMQLGSNSGTNLTVWGHAGQKGYGGGSTYYSPKEFVDELMDKGLAESSINKIEILGCAPNNSDDGTASYTQMVQQILNNYRDNGALNRLITVWTYPAPEAYDSSTDFRFDKIGKFLYVYGPSDDLRAWEQKIISLWSYGSDPILVESANYKMAVKQAKLFKDLKYKTDSYTNVRSHLVKAGLPKTHKKGVIKSEHTELLISDHF